MSDTQVVVHGNVQAETHFERRRLSSALTLGVAVSSFFFFALGGSFAVSIGTIVGIVGASLAAWRWYHPLIVLTPQGFRANIAPFRRYRGLAWADTAAWAIHRGVLGFASVTGERIVLSLGDLGTAQRDRLVAALELLQLPRDYLAVFSDSRRAYQRWKWKGRVAVATLISLYLLAWKLSA